MKVHATPGEETVTRHAYGVIFQREGRIEILKSKWIHHFDLELMMPVPPPTTALPSQSPLSSTPCQEETCVIKKGLVEIATMITEQAHQKVNEQIEEIHERLQAGVPTETKQTRSLLPFIGSISHALFGTATDSDLEATKQQILQIMNKGRAATDVLEQQIRELTTATSITNKRIDAIKRQVDTNVALLTDMALGITKSGLDNIKALGYMSELLLNYVEVSTHLNEIKIGINELVSGRLSPSIISQMDLQRTLSGINKIIKGYGSNNRILTEHANFYYRKNDHVVVRYDNRLLITIKIPIGTYNSSFDLYRVISYPQAVSAAHNHSTVITGLKNYFAINQDQTAYAVWEEKPTFEMGEGSQLIWERNIQIRTDNDNCILALFRNDPEKVIKLCDFVLMNQKIANVFSIAKDKVLLENVEGAKIVCQNSTNATWIETCTSCIIKTAKGCFVETKELRTIASIPQNIVTTEVVVNQQTESTTLASTLQDGIRIENPVTRVLIGGDGSPIIINKPSTRTEPLPVEQKNTPATNLQIQESQSQISHSLNLAIIQSFFAKEDWEKFKGDLTVDERPSVELPEFKSFQNTSRETEKADKNLVQQLETALAKVRNNEPIFEKAKSEYEYSLDTDIMSTWKQNFWKLGENIGFLANLVVEVIMLIIITYILIRLHQLTILIMSQGKLTLAGKIVLKQSTTTKSMPHNLTAEAFGESSTLNSYQSFVLSLLIFIILLLVIKRILQLVAKCRQRNKEWLGLKIENERHAVVLNWFQLKKDISEYNVLAKTHISGIKLQKSCFQTLFKFEWNFLLQEKDSDICFTLPNKILVPRGLRVQLKKLIEIDGNFSVFPIVRKNDSSLGLTLERESPSLPSYSATRDERHVQSLPTAPVESKNEVRIYPQLY